jgi:hypothetical protein
MEIRYVRTSPTDPEAIDTTIHEIHKIREQISDQFGGDIAAILADARARQEKEGSRTVTGDELDLLAYRAVPTSALAKSVALDDLMMHVTLLDGRVIGVPIVWFPLLRNATPEQRTKYEIGGGGISLHWEEIDEDISIAGLMAGADMTSL